jgi:hypothetical protein
VEYKAGFNSGSKTLKLEELKSAAKITLPVNVK